MIFSFTDKEVIMADLVLSSNKKINTILYSDET